MEILHPQRIPLYLKPHYREEISPVLLQRITRDSVEPLPPLCGGDGPYKVPLLAFCMEFSRVDEVAYAKRFKLESGAKMAWGHLGQNLPDGFNRWTLIQAPSGKTLWCLVLATNESERDMERVFDLDMVELIRRLMGFGGIANWVEPGRIKRFPAGLRTPKSKEELEAMIGGWPEDLPRCEPLEWDTAFMVPPEYLIFLDWAAIRRYDLYWEVRNGQEASLEQDEESDPHVETS
ncbi:hypothetical protein EST38_g3611 [Candolleomyces aberdarensis]|uniref:Uncharacterized protein n=1 Tax=Candolleomyces aberdarensis TaxID=2316362 RepID=A0A4Q2DT29_9AGAR|nr:hypothetical protein EST38_g3611 [Candolleomyces aberdarensis]